MNHKKITQFIEYWIGLFLYTLKWFIIWLIIVSLGTSMLLSISIQAIPPLKKFTDNLSQQSETTLIIYLSLIALFMLIVTFFLTRYKVVKTYGLKKKEKPQTLTKTIEETFSVPMEFINYHFTLKASPQEIIIPNPFRSLFVTGTAGSGKTVSIGFQLIQQAVKKNYSILQYDFKSPILTNYLESARIEFKSDFKHFYVNFDDITTSHRVNPLNPKFIPSSTYAREYASAIIQNLLPESIKKNDYWMRSSTDLLTACIWYLRDEHPDKCTLPHVCNLILSDDKELLELLKLNSESEDLTKSIYNAMKRRADAQLAGVIGTLQSAISKINTPEINYLLSGNDFDLDINNPDEPKYVSIGSTPDLVDTFSPVISLIFTVAFKQMNKQNKHQALVLLDEAPTLYIPKLESLPATARENKVALAYMCQDISQMIDMFGQTKTESIISNLNNQFFGRSTNPKSAEHISRLFGKEDVTYITQSESESQNQGYSTGSSSSSQSSGSSYSASKNQSIQERPRIRPQQVLDLETGQFICTIADNKTKRLKWQLNLPDDITPSKIRKIHYDINARDTKASIKNDIKEIFKKDMF